MTSGKKYCLYCGNEFPYRKGKKFCCSQCAVRWHNEHREKPIHEVKRCVICGKEFTAWNRRQITCGDKVCAKTNEKNTKKANPKKYTYPHKKNEGIAKPSPKALNSLTSPASKRWARMSWKDLTLELEYYGLTYKQSQLMAEKNTLPEEFGLRRKKKNANNKRCPSTDTDL